MARPLRIELAGGLYHITSRGDQRENVYLDDADRAAWLEVFAQVCTRYNWRCHAWCLMSDHYHIVVETIEGNLAKGMRQLNGVYTQAFNRRHGHMGHVFQGRYKAILVEKDSYLLELARYVVLNPLRARMVRRVQDWPWSSYHAMTGTEAAPAWLQTDWLLAQFSKQRSRAVARYQDFVREGIGLPSLWEQLQGQIFLGSKTFINRVLKRAEQLNAAGMPRSQRRPVAKPLSHYVRRSKSDKQAMVAAYGSGSYTLQQIAQHMGVHYATVSRAVKAHEAKPD